MDKYSKHDRLAALYMLALRKHNPRQPSNRFNRTLHLVTSSYLLLTGKHPMPGYWNHIIAADSPYRNRRAIVNLYWDLIDRYDDYQTGDK